MSIVVNKLYLGLYQATLLLIISTLASGRIEAHEVQENTATISARHGALSLDMRIHKNKWTEKTIVSKLDDRILAKTSLFVNGNLIKLRLRRIEKSGDHYRAQFIAKQVVSEELKSAELSLPRELGRVMVTVVRAKTMVKTKGAKARFIF